MPASFPSLFLHPLMPWRPRVARVLLLALAATLAACGGGGDDPAPALAKAGDPRPAVEAADAADTARAAQVQGPGLRVEPVRVVDETASGQRVLRTVGALADGGFVLAWLAREASDPPSAWTLWAQRFAADGTPAAPAVRLPHAQEVAAPGDIAAAVLPEGRLGLVWATQRLADPARPWELLSEVHGQVLALDGTAIDAPRTLQAVTYDRYSPHSFHIGGPVTATAGRDGSWLAAWRGITRGPSPFAPDYRVQRLAAHGHPLEWIHHFGGREATHGFRLTTLDEGGWIATLVRQRADIRPYAHVMQIAVPRPLAMPPVQTLAGASFVLDLRGRGSVLFSGQVGIQPTDSLNPYSLRFDRFGSARQRHRLPGMPASAVALQGGDYVTLHPAQPDRISLQRYTPGGQPVGERLWLPAAAVTQAAGLRRDGLVLAWVASDEAGTRLLTQRLGEVVPATP